MGHYTGHILSSGMGASPEFTSAPLSRQPGTPSPLSADSSILLAGGFPAASPDASFPLSPTLQLNGDFTEIKPDNLAALARAEYSRFSSCSYRTFSLEADPRVTVIGNNTDGLHRFIDTYGGILEISPILLQQYDPELTTAEELQIEATQKGVSLKFTTRRPFSPDRCNSCGECGRICPLQCISPELFLDFTRCDLCKECLTVCPNDAIDLYSIERRDLSTPALLLLDGTETELPEPRTAIYFESSLPALFASIYASEIEEIISWNPAICQYSGRLQTGCSGCAESCLHGALTQDATGVHIDHSACTECGSCLASCPTGALQYERFSDRQFVEYFRSFPLPAGTTVVLADEQSLHSFWWHSPQHRFRDLFFMEFPRPRALHALHFLLLFAMGAKRIIITGKEPIHQTQQIQFTNTVLRKLFKGNNGVELIPLQSLYSLLENDSSTAVPDHVYHDFSFSNRRQKLSDILLFLRMQSISESAIMTGSTVTDFGSIRCDDKRCTQCLACINECRIEALTADSKEYSLNHIPALCVQCGICVTICPENALTAKNGLFLEDTFFQERVIAQAEPARCKACGKIFGTQKSLEKVLAVLAAKNMWNGEDDLLSYCDECRVINLYESGKQV